MGFSSTFCDILIFLACCRLYTLNTHQEEALWPRLTLMGLVCLFLSEQHESLGGSRVPEEKRGDQCYQSGRRRIFHLRDQRHAGQLPTWHLVSQWQMKCTVLGVFVKAQHFIFHQIKSFTWWMELNFCRFVCIIMSIHNISSLIPCMWDRW